MTSDVSSREPRYRDLHPVAGQPRVHHPNITFNFRFARHNRIEIGQSLCDMPSDKAENIPNEITVFRAAAGVIGRAGGVRGLREVPLCF